MTMLLVMNCDGTRSGSRCLTTGTVQLVIDGVDRAADAAQSLGWQAERDKVLCPSCLMAQARH